MPSYTNPNKDWQNTVTGPITAASLAPTPAIQYQNPSPVSPYPVNTLISQPLSAPEQQGSDLTKQIQELNTSLSGKDAYSIQAQQNYQVPDLQKQLDEYNSKIMGLANQASSLDLASNYTIPNQMQLNAAGRGITTGGLAPIQASELRKIQIQKGAIASDALSTKAAADAVQGKLTSALYYADLAVKQKYAGLEGELKAKMANLDLVMKSPEYSKAQKDRAQQQQIALEQQQNELNTQKDNQKTIQGLALQALQNGAPPVVVDQIMKAQDLPSAFNAASGYAAKETATSIQEYQFAVKNGYKGSYTQYQNEDANRKAAVARAGVAGLSTAQQGRVLQIAGNFDNEQAVKNYQTVAEGKQFMDSIPNNTKNPADQQGIIYAFAKIMDPNSVVREGEYNTVQKYAQSWAQTYGFNAQRIFSNSPFLSEEAVRNMKATINAKVGASEKAYKNIYGEYGRRINVLTGGNDGAQYLTDYSRAFAPTSAAPTNTPQFTTGDIITPQGPMGPQFRVNADGTATRIK